MVTLSWIILAKLILAVRIGTDNSGLSVDLEHVRGQVQGTEQQLGEFSCIVLNSLIQEALAEDSRQLEKVVLANVLNKVKF